MHLRLIGFLFSLLATGSAHKSVPLQPPSKGSTPFTRLTAEQTGIDFVSPLLVDHPLNYLYHSGFACGSVAIGDINQDGWPDIFLANGPGENALYLQKTDQRLQFHDVAASLGLGGENRWASGSAMVDIDNDGDLDIYVCNYRGKHQLYVNQLVPAGKLGFEEQAAAYGLNLVNASMTPAFADIDRDGDLDLFMLNNRLERPGGRPSKPPYQMVDGKPQVLPEFANFYHLRQSSEKNFQMDTYGQPDRIYRNEGGKFTDITAKSGISGIGHGLSATWWDYNEDGFPDLYVGNDFTDPDRLYRNNRDGTFTDVLAETMPYCSWSSMGSASADLNNDGLPDMFSADMAATSHFKQKVNMGDMSKHRWLMETGWPRQAMRNMLYVNTGIHRFKETAYMSGLSQSNWTWAVKLADFDCDGLTDVFLTNGMARNFSDADIPMTPEMLVGRTEFDAYKDTPPMPEKNLAFRNEGGLKFDDVSKAWGLDDLGMSYGAAQGDMDRDGDIDLVVLNLDDAVRVFRNDQDSGNRIVIECKGVTSNRAGWGATVRLETEGVNQMRFLHPISGFQGCDMPEAHFGLGTAKRVDVLTIDWPSGRRTVLSDMAAGQRYVISEPVNEVMTPALAQEKTLFEESSETLGLTHPHQERLFDDYVAQPLLPGKLSQLGGGVAWGDFDGDGDDDLFAGGAAGSSGVLYRNDGQRLVRRPGPWTKDRECEDMGVLWFDADVDGDLDLFVGSGGVEHPLGDAALHDRLYLNQGKGVFARAAEDSFPQVGYSSSAVSAADIDRDGDLDLFIGSRSVPGKYPEIPVSRFLRNESAAGKVRFVEDTIPELAKVGLVTGATWLDANDDGWMDLAVVTEWGSPRIFVSKGGVMSDQSEAADLSNHAGWWNGVAAGDLDGDGDFDLVATNVGLNTKYGQPSLKKPTLLYYGDMDGTGVAQLVEAKPGENGLLPIRGRSCSSKAMPFLEQKFANYRAFASASLEAIYTPNTLDKAQRFAATEFQTGVFMNVSTNDQVRFEYAPLPFEAQASPGFGVSVFDADGDGNLDITVVGNLYSREPETGLWRGSMGLVLNGNGKGDFAEMPYGYSGFVVPGDGKSLTRTDLNGDGVPDLVAGQNNDRLLAFQNDASSKAYVSVRLQGKAGNSSAIGSKLTLHLQDGSKATAVVDGGSGYLSQSSAEVFFGLGLKKPKELTIRWPDGNESLHDVKTAGQLRLAHP